MSKKKKKATVPRCNDIRIARVVRASSLLLLFENVDTFLRGKNVNEEEIVPVFVRDTIKTRVRLDNQ